MHTKGPKEDPLVDMGYEVRDIDYKGFGIAAAIFVAFGLFSFVVVGLWFWLYNPQMEAKLNPRQPMPAPLLQDNITVRSEIEDMRQKETLRLSTAGQNQDGSYRIPIDAAMREIAEKGLPHAESTVPAVSPGNTIPQNALQPAPGSAPTNGMSRGG